MKKLLIIMVTVMLASPVLATDWDWTTPYVADAGTKLLYHFDEGAGLTVGDASSYGNDGTVTAFTWINNPVPAVPVEFWDTLPAANASRPAGFGSYGVGNAPGGSSVLQYVPADYDMTGLELSGSVTIDFWLAANPDVVYTGEGCFFWANNAEFSVWGDFSSGTGFQLQLRQQSHGIVVTDPNTVIPYGEWNHGRIIIDEDTLAGSSETIVSFYVNGVFSSSFVTPAYTGSYPLTTGFRTMSLQLHGGSFWHGALDEFRIQSGVIPEPTTISLLAIAALAFLKRK